MYQQRIKLSRNTYIFADSKFMLLSKLNQELGINGVDFGTLNRLLSP